MIHSADMDKGVVENNRNTTTKDSRENFLLSAGVVISGMKNNPGHVELCTKTLMHEILRDLLQLLINSMPQVSKSH